MLLPGLFSQQDVEMARERIFLDKFGEVKEFSNQDDKHNNYSGLTWGLLSRGRVFCKGLHSNMMTRGRTHRNDLFVRE